jgi:dTDP-4-dehydrorhamnose reductase
MRILVIGGSGMLGIELCEALAARGYEVSSPDRRTLDITDPVAVARIATGELGAGARWCVNCAAYTNVDAAESEVEAAGLLNALAPAYVAAASHAAGMRLIHLSTDFVFDGAKGSPYEETDRINPLGVYGKTKADGELAVVGAQPGAVIVRTAWLYGARGKCFPKTVIRAWLDGRPLRVVADQYGCPTYSRDLARVLADLIEKDPPGGIYHAAGPDILSWHAFALLAIETYARERGLQDRPIAVEAIRTGEWPTPAPRPRYSALACHKIAALGIEAMPPAAESLRDFCRRLNL